MTRTEHCFAEAGPFALRHACHKWRAHTRLGALRDLLDRREDEVEGAAAHVLDKNRELYRRLALRRKLL